MGGWVGLTVLEDLGFGGEALLPQGLLACWSGWVGGWMDERLNG